jgi:hypothetical protein
LIENLEDFFYHIDLEFTFIDDIYTELNKAEWYTSKHRQCRADISKDLRFLIQNVMPFKIDDAGFFKNEPGWDYGIHKDSKRFAAVNMLMVENSNNFCAFVYNNNLKNKELIPYAKNKLVLLNTKQFHSVSNNSKTDVRYLLSLGSTEESFESVKNKFKKDAMYKNRIHLD